jgi:hypothetical protein
MEVENVRKPTDSNRYQLKSHDGWKLMTAESSFKSWKFMTAAGS